MSIEKQLQIIGMKIKTARMESNMTSSAFARKIGINRESLRFIEAGTENPKIRTLLTIQHELKINNLFPNDITEETKAN